MTARASTLALADVREAVSDGLSTCGPDTKSTTTGAHDADMGRGTVGPGSASSGVANSTGAIAADDTSDSDGGFVPTPDLGELPPGLPNGEACEDDSECSSGSCFLFPSGGGLCSQCAADDECMVEGGPGTCSFGGNGWAACTEGQAGVMCQPSLGCADNLTCASLFEGALVDLCSECETDAQCPEQDLPPPVEVIPLSERQLEVSKLVCLGLTNAVIAERLSVSPRTVTCHLDHIYTRLAIRSRAEFVHYLAKRNLA